VARAVLGIMFAMAALGLAFAWATREFRRHNDHLDQTAEEPLGPVEPVAPAQMPPLEFMPQKVNVIAGIHVAELLENPGGRLLLPQLKISEANIDLNNLEKTTGLKLADVEQVALGLQLEQELHGYLVVHTRREYDPEHVRISLHGKNAGARNNRPMFSFVPQNGKGATNLTHFVGWCAGPRMLVFCWPGIPENVNALPVMPTTSLARFDQDLGDRLQQLPVGAQVWAVGHCAPAQNSQKSWKDFLDALALQQLLMGHRPLAAQDREALERVRTFAAWLQFDKLLQGTLWVDCDSPADARAFDKYLATQHVNPESVQRLFGKDDRPRRLIGSFLDSRGQKQKGQRVRVTAHTNLEGINLKSLMQPARPGAPLAPPGPPMGLNKKPAEAAEQAGGSSAKE
jgi:hypothetical protein